MATAIGSERRNRATRRTSWRCRSSRGREARRLMTLDLDVHLTRLHLTNARRVWRDLIVRAEKEQWSHGQLLETLFAEEVAHRRGTRLMRATRAAAFPFLRTVGGFDFPSLSTLGSPPTARCVAPASVPEGGS